MLILNKKDLVAPQRAQDVAGWWKKRIKISEVIEISALHQEDTASLLSKIIEMLPEGDPYYPEDQLTDRPERFFVGEIIREKILILYGDEIPYSTEVTIESFQETQTNAGEPLARIQANIYVMRDSQKAIILGKGGSAIKKLGSMARVDIEKFLQSKVFLETTVKVRDNWRDDDRSLQYFGY